MICPDIVDAIRTVAAFCGNPGLSVSDSDEETGTHVERSIIEQIYDVGVCGH